ncbi:hypothetical protein JAAARDRAFT_39025 [Jaapia argillacea MUCL 33604]|uniref:Major facilitator superfamily (MFS) profile domain-containing protein n=1 Tax=Jaapia argillacea MUCL 33604 TaxID=933084 RepID=A0A067PIP8_9AGAM|nr:hypothetical protein JAAARDRAFT_39025 [Jaapia argillacea MUCL 33604]
MTPSISSRPSNEKGDNEKLAQTVQDYDSGTGESQFGDVDMKKLLWKIDLHILPVLCVMYLLAFLDRVNISNAVLFGLQTDLHLTGLQYNNALVIFFVPYIIFEIPSNLLLKHLKPHVWLSICMFGFGLVMTLQGLTQNYAGLLATRFFLGLFESVMFPGSFYILANFYRREESQKRFSFFFCSTTLAGAFGGLLASGIGKLDGARGLRGWRWVFIIEGAFTCVIAIIWFFLLPDFPEDAKFLTEAERNAVKARLQADVGPSALHQKIGWRDVLDVFKDYKIFLGGLMYFGLIVPAYGYAYFAPTIIKNLGYGAIQTQLRSVPPWACAFAFAMIVSFVSDRTRHRWLFTVGSALLALVGFAILISVHGKSTTHVHTQYAALFLAAMGAYTSMPVIVGWFNTNLAGHKRRAVGSAWQVGFGNIGGIIAAYSFPSADAPQFTKGYAICIAFVCLSIVSSTAYMVGITIENRRRDRLGVEGVGLDGEGGVGEGVSPEEEERLGDLHPAYRYIR